MAYLAGRFRVVSHTYVCGIFPRQAKTSVPFVALRVAYARQLQHGVYG